MAKDDVGSMDNIMKLNLFGESADGVGVAETPSGKPYDAASIKVPAKEEITVDTYNSALAALKKSFKEGVEVMEMLENCKVVDEDKDAKQDSYTEDAIYNAIVESYYNGPIFESVEKENKEEIRSIAKKVKNKLCKFTRKIKSIFHKTTTGSRFALLDPFLLDKLSGDLKLYSWQTVCILNPESGTTMGKILSSLNEEFKEELTDDYELKIIKMNFILRALGKMEELTDDDKAASRKLTKWYILIVDGKKETSPNEVQVKINKSDLAKLIKIQSDDGSEGNKGKK